MVVNQRCQHLAVVLADGVLGRVIDIAPDVDKVLEVLAEDGVVYTSLWCQHVYLSVLVGHHHLLLCCPLGVSSEIGVARLLVEAINSLHHIFLVHNLAQQLSVQIIQIQVVISVALAWQQNVVACNLHIVEHLFLHILIHLVFDGQFAYCRQWISHIDTQHILMAIHRKDGYLRCIACGFDARYVAVFVKRQVDFASLMALDVVAPHAYLRVYLSWHRILVGIIAWIFSKLLALWLCALKQLHRVLLYSTLVVANPDNLLRISREHHRRVCREFLLVHPVGYAVYYLVALAILGHLTLCIIVQQLHQIDVIVAHKSYLITIRRKDRRLLWTAIAQGLQFVVSDAIYIIGGGKRATINRLGVSLYQHPCAIRTQYVSIHALHLSTSRAGSIKQHASLLASLKRVSDNLLAVVANLRVSLAISHWAHSTHCLTFKLSACNSFQRNFLSS